MYCSACGSAVVQGLSYCNYCGAKLSGEKGDSLIKSSEVKPESLVWGMIAVLIFGFVGITFLMMAMKMVGLNEGPILALTILSFLLMGVVEAVFISQLLRRRGRSEETRNTALSGKQSAREIEAAQARALSAPVPSVTEHTTRSFEPLYRERK
jgi:hypothetical protein